MQLDLFMSLKKRNDALLRAPAPYKWELPFVFPKITRFHPAPAGNPLLRGGNRIPAA